MINESCKHSHTCLTTDLDGIARIFVLNLALNVFNTRTVFCYMSVEFVVLY